MYNKYIKRKEEKYMTLRREFTEEFKIKMVKLYNSGKLKAEIVREYDLTPSTFNTQIKRINATGSVKEADNRTPEEIELIKIRKKISNLKWKMIF